MKHPSIKTSTPKVMTNADISCDRFNKNRYRHMKKVCLLFVFITIVVSSVSAQEVYWRKVTLMGCDFKISIVDTSKIEADKHINTAIAEITRIEKLISSWDKNSETSQINASAGIKPVSVSLELFQLISRAKKISKLTDGAFDISYAAMDRIWKFDGSMKTIPDTLTVKKSILKVGNPFVILNKKNRTVFLKHKGMKIGFGGIGKGYAADKAKQLLIKNGAKAGIINASGDMNTWGKQPNGKQWTIGITNPLNKKSSYALLPISDRAVVTSGDYERYVMINNKRYAHIIDPRTGYPTQGITSVTVFAPQAELADALATSVFVMGAEVGLNRINQLPNIECIIIDDTGAISTSDNIKIKKL